MLVLCIYRAQRGAQQFGLQPVEGGQPHLAVLGEQLRSGRWRGGAHIRTKVHQAEIGFMADASDDGHRTARHRAHQRFVIESPQVFQRAPTAHEQDHVQHRQVRREQAVRPHGGIAHGSTRDTQRVQTLQRPHQLSGGIGPLHC